MTKSCRIYKYKVRTIKNEEGKIVYNEAEKREPYAKCFENPQTTLAKHQIITDWNQIFEEHETLRDKLADIHLM